MPGIGLGGLFFVLSALVMLILEVVLTVRGRSSLRRWRLVAYQSGIAAGIVLSTVGMLWLLDLLLLGAVRGMGGEAAGTTIGAATSGEGAVPEAVLALPVSAAPILGTLVLLCLVLCLSEVLRWVVRRPPGPARKGS